MMKNGLLVCILLILLPVLTKSFYLQVNSKAIPSLSRTIEYNPNSLSNGRLSITKCNLFNFFKNNDNNKSEKASAETTTAVVAGRAADASKVAAMKASLEKISNKQNRDYAQEAKDTKSQPIRIRDKQSQSYNFGKADEFPNLYKGWFRNDGDQIAKQMSSSVKKAIQSGEKYIEVLFDPVPNLDEVSVGTALNQRFRMDVASNLKVPDYATNRGGPATLEWSTLYWANRLAEDVGKIKQNIVALSLSGQGIPQGSKGIKPSLHPSLSLYSFSESMKPNSLLSTKQIKADLLIVLSPCQSNHYNDAKKLADKLGIPVIALNAPFSHIYDVGGGAPFNLAYVMKRIPKGWIYRQNPKPFEIIIEGPDYEITRAATVPKQPTLIEMTKISMAKSSEIYGTTGNDRIFQNRL